MRVIVCGSRGGVDPRVVWGALLDLHARSKITCLVHGAARGVDSDADRWARLHRVPVEEHPADWKAHGKAAGPIRNEIMAKRGADLCLAIHTGTPGTRDMIRRARAHGITVREHLVTVVDRDTGLKVQR